MPKRNDINKVMIIGNVGEAPRIISVKPGRPVCNFSVATNRSWLSRGETERKEETQWHNVVVFNKLAEICSQILTKGTKVFVSGRLQGRKITDRQGQEIKKIEIAADQVIGLDKRITQ